MRPFFVTTLLLFLVGVYGCARWDPPEKQARMIFPKSRIALDAVGLELGIAQLDSSQSETFESFWKMLDQQALPLELRKRLDQNGIRAAIMPSHAPAILQKLVDPKPIRTEELTKLEKQLYAKGLLRKKQRMISHERISNREGQAHAISVSDYHPQISWVVRAGEMETPGYGESVRGVITVTTFPQGDGSVRLVFGPEIHHGQSRPQIGVAERSFLKEARQSVNRIDELKFEVTLRPGESIVLAPTSDVAELGDLFFGAADSTLETPGSLDVAAPAARPVPAHRMLLVRVVQTQMDDLFDDSNLIEKLTSTPRH